MSFKSAYLKLTVIYVVIVMVISFAFSVLLYQISSSELNRGLGRQGEVLRNLPPPEFVPQSRVALEKTRIAQLEESNNHLRTNLIYFNLLILFVSGGLSYFLARRTLRPIEEMVDIQNRFTADASHELRTPLTAMKTEIEVSLRDKKLNISDAKKLLGSNLEEIGKLETLSNELLSLAKYQDIEELPFEKVNLKEVVDGALGKVEALAKNKEIKFDSELVDVETKANRQSLVELAVILLENAVKYSPKDSKIAITTETRDKHAYIKVQDWGIGIKEADIPFIFNRFYRADISRSKEVMEGYGLGLSIAKKIVEKHHGKIEVESKPDSGSTFTVGLPVV
jgi:signal transduction histidine kinase